jgi:hypothetical protein
MKPADIIKKYRCDKAERKIVQHQDVIKIDGCGRIRRDDVTGFLAGCAPIAKVGVMSYLMADGTVLNELVPAETLFDEDSMATLKLKPVTNQHPSDKKVNSENASYEQVGYTGESITKEDEVFLATNMVITDQWAIDAILEDGREELSPGYEAELVFQKGEFEGIQYDAIQVARRYNHVAIVDNARGGTEIRMKLDNADNFGYEKGIKIKNDDSKTQPNKKEYSMKYRIDGIEYDADQQVINYITKLETDAKTNATALQTKTDEVETITADRDTLKAKNDELANKDINAEVQARVDERIALERTANVVLDKVDGIDKLDNRGLKLAIIENKFPELHKKSTIKRLRRTSMPFSILSLTV